MKLNNLFWFGLLLLLFSECGYKTKEIVTIGVILPLTGNLANYGAEAKKGIELALGQIKNKNIRIKYIDSEGNAERFISKFKSEIEEEKINIFIGDLFSSITEQIAPLADKYEKVLITPSSSSLKINTGKYVFRTCASDKNEIKTLVDFILRNYNEHSYTICFIEDSYGYSFSYEISNQLRLKGKKVVNSYGFIPGTIKFGDLVSKIKSHKEVGPIIIIGYYELGYLLNELRKINISENIISTVMFDNKTIFEIAKENVNNVVFSSRNYNVDSKDILISEFVKRYKSKYKEIPTIFSALSYDALNLVNYIVTRVGDNPSAFRSKLYCLDNYKGVCGFINFDKDGELERIATIYRVVNGKKNKIN